jgi:hypothetical protein
MADESRVAPGQSPSRSASSPAAAGRKERGWAGHFVCGYRCLFRRNTLVWNGERRVVISTVGNMLMDGKREEIGCNRHYETMAFEAKREGEYWEADVSAQINLDCEWAIEELTETSDLRADEMHERAVIWVQSRLLADLLDRSEGEAGATPEE